jgi:hypothetical protein
LLVIDYLKTFADLSSFLRVLGVSVFANLTNGDDPLVHFASPGGYGLNEEVVSPRAEN